MLRRPPLHYPDQPFHKFLRDAADSYPERIGLLYDDQSFTYRELDGCANAFANVLIAAGVGPRDRVAIVVANRPEWIVTQYAVSIVGAAAVVPNPRWTPSELAHALGLTHPTVVVADAESAPVIDGITSPDVRICVDDDAPTGWLPFWDLVFGTSGQRPNVVVDDWGSLDVVLPFSSGTTGLPKAVRHTHRSLVAGTVSCKSALTIGDDDRLQLFLPLFHIYGIVMVACALASGAPLTLFPRFDLDTMLAHIQRERITLGFGAAPIAVAMANHPRLEDYDLSSLRYFLWAATPIALDVAEAVTRRSGVRWLHAYGATEAPILHCNPVHDPDRCRLDSAGLPASDEDVMVVDIETRAPVEDGEIGEILVRGPHVMAGYLPESANAEAFENGWLRTGDIGWVEAEGWVHLTDRAKEMLKVNAFQVAPAELEQVLLAHPAVADCAVYGVPDDRTGEAPKAAVVVARGASVSEEELVSWVAERVATYKRLRAVEFIDEVPRTATGKVLRRLLRDADQQRRLEQQ